MSDVSSPEPKASKASLAMAMAARRTVGKKKMMASGGEISAADESKASADEKMKRDMEMLHGAKTMGKWEENFDEESQSKNSIDGAKDEREMDMYAKGGIINAWEESLSSNSADSAADDKDEDMISGKPRRHRDELRAASGRPVADDKDEMELDMYAKGGIVDSIMRKRKMMAEGGEVDLEENGKEDLNNLDDMNYKAGRKDTYYDDSQLSDQPEDSNLHGDDLSDEDSHDMVSSIRKKMRSLK